MSHLKNRAWFICLTAILLVGGLDQDSYSQEEKTKLAIFPFNNTTNRAEEVGFGDSIADMLITAFQRGGNFIIVERSQIDLIFKEQELGAAGITEQAIQLGKNLGVNIVVTGGVAQFSAGSNIEIDARMIDATDGRVIAALDDTAANENVLRETVNRLAQRIENEYLGRFASILSIFSEPLGATVLINREEIGITPLEKQLEPGNYSVEVRHENYENWAQSVSISESQRVQISAVLQASSGAISIMSIPLDTTIFLDGSEKGQTPLVIEDVTLGRHTLRLSKKDYQNWEEDIQVEKDKRIEISARLKTISSLLQISAAAKGALISSGGTIFINDAEKGQAPLTIGDLSEGTYRIKASRWGYKDSLEEVTLEINQKRDLHLEMEEEGWKIFSKWGGLGGGLASGLGAFLSFQGAGSAYDQYQKDTDPTKMNEHINQAIMFNVFTGVLGVTSGVLLAGSTALFVW